jgi:CMP-2-keto-3-deoxyoctulosonic acid synthetase
MHAGVYTRERNHIGSILSRVTGLALPLVAKNLARRTLEDSQSRQRLMIATKNKQRKQINKQYTIQYLMTKKTIPNGATHCYEHVSARTT